MHFTFSFGYVMLSDVKRNYSQGITHRLAYFTAGVSDQMRFAQFDIYFPISIGFQILALPGFVKLADIFGYAEAKAQKELQNALLRADSKHEKSKLQSISTGGSLISAESIRAGDLSSHSACYSTSHVVGGSIAVFTLYE